MNAARHVSLCMLSAAMGALAAYLVPERATVLLMAAGLAVAAGVVILLPAGPRPRHAERRRQTVMGGRQSALRLGEMLMNYGLLSEADLRKALSRQQKSGKRLGQVMLQMKLITPHQLLEVVEEQASRRQHTTLMMLTSDD
jgi:hypothetical protein